MKIFDAHSMSEAVALAHQYAQSESVVLLSPAAASFGMFEDYRDRGNQFKKAVTDIPGSA